MTNLEHIFQDMDLVNILITGKLAVKNGKPVNCIDTIVNGKRILGLSCTECDFEDSTCCQKKRDEYLRAEYEPTPKLTKRERAFLDSLLSCSNYMARDINGNLFVYTTKPHKDVNVWESDDQSVHCTVLSKYFFGDLFSFITWNDTEPTSVEYLRKLEVVE